MVFARAPRRLPTPRRAAAWAAAVAALSLVVGAPAAVLAADPVGTVTVTVVDDGTHEPVVGAHVTLSGFTDTAADSVFTAFATTSASGAATFGDVPRTVAGSPVSVVADATLTDATTSDGCTISHEWAGSSEPTAVATSTAIEVQASRRDEATCDPPGPGAPVLSGTVLDENGQPFEVLTGTITMQRPDGGEWHDDVKLDAGGRFSIAVEPWGTTEAPAHLSLLIVGDITGTEEDGDCSYDLAPRVTLDRTVSLAGGATLEPLMILAPTERVGGVCGVTGTPGPTATARPTPKPTTDPTATPTRTPGTVPGGTTAAPTLPPTDGTGIATDGTRVALPVGGLLVLAGLVGFAAVARSSRRSR